MMMSIQKWMVVASLMSSLLGVTSEETSIFSCDETMMSELTPLNEPCEVAGNTETFRCVQLLPNLIHHEMDQMTTLFSVVETYNDTDNSTEDEITLCISMTSIHKRNILNPSNGKTLEQNMTFSRNLTVGLLEVNRICWTLDGSNCTHRVLLRADILALPPVAYTPDDSSFWNFSSPLLSARAGWVETLQVAGSGLELEPSALKGLSGSGLRELLVNGAAAPEGDAGLEPAPRAPGAPLPPIDHLPRLVKLDISHCRITGLADECFNNTPSIEHLFLNENSLSEIPDCIKRLKNLKSLRIESNFEDFIFSPERLNGLGQLENLTLSGSHIAEWQEHNFSLPSLRSLSLSRCGLTTIHPAPMELPVLEHLDLSGNFLQVIPPFALRRLVSLKFVLLNDNALSVWPNFPAANLQRIHLSNNNISYLVNLGDRGLVADYLDVSQNNIGAWDDDRIFNSWGQLPHTSANKGEVLTPQQSMRMPTFFTRTPPLWVQRMNLSLNKIAVLTRPMIKSFSLLKEVDLGGNPWDCDDCQLPAMKYWLESTSVNVLNLGTSLEMHNNETSLRCASPFNVRGWPVEHVDLSVPGCEAPGQQLLWTLAVPLGVLAAMVLLLTGVALRYRADLAYLAHAASVRRRLRRVPPCAPARNGVDAHAPSRARGCLYDAFLCYSGRERDFAKKLAAIMESKPHNYKLCLFERDFRAVPSFTAETLEAMGCSRKVIVVLSMHFALTQWSQWEMEMTNSGQLWEDRAALVLLELEPLDRDAIPRHLRFLLDTRELVRWPRATSANAHEKAALAQLMQALGPSLANRRCAIRHPASTDDDDDDDSQREGHGTNECTPLLGRSAPVRIIVRQ